MIERARRLGLIAGLALGCLGPGCSGPSAASSPGGPKPPPELGPPERGDDEAPAVEAMATMPTVATPERTAGGAARGSEPEDAEASAAARPPREAPSSPREDLGEDLGESPSRPTEDPWLLERLRSRPEIARVLEDPARHRLQILVTVIEPGPDGPEVEEHGYRVGAEYVYPASAIKTFASVAALRKLAALRAQGHRVGRDTPLSYCEGDRGPCTSEDPSNLEGGTITVGHEIRKMQLVSNNVAFNRLYELVGHRDINEDLWGLGFSSLRIHHRMYGVQDALAQRTTPRVELRPRRGARVVVPARISELVLPPTESRGMQIGRGYVDDQTHARVEEPLDFSRKNYVSVRDLHRLTLALARPDLPGVPDLGLDRADREFLLRAMTEDPLESKNPIYTRPHDSGLRYHTMIRGMMKFMPQEQIRYVGKAGRAYGFHLDNAYIEDTKSGRAVAVTVVVYANANGILNDNKYEYDGVTRPLLKGMGMMLVRRILRGT